MFRDNSSNANQCNIAMPPGGHSPHNSYMGGQGVPSGAYPTQNHQHDTTGQIAPAGMKPRVTATLWEDEGSMCFQVEAKGVCVARRDGMAAAQPYLPKGIALNVMHFSLILRLIVFSDNHMINGTKLLNVAGMTRGRRDGILKSEKLRHVVKIGPMHLKGVWYGNAPLNVE